MSQLLCTCYNSLTSFVLFVGKYAADAYDVLQDQLCHMLHLRHLQHLKFSRPLLSHLEPKMLTYLAEH